MRVSVFLEEKRKPDSDRPVGGCPVKLKIEDGRWIAEIQDPVKCAPTIERMEELGPEARANLSRHLETNDLTQKDQIKVMRRRNSS